MINRQEQIRKKGFRITPEEDGANFPSHDFSKIRLNGRSLEDAIFSLGSYSKVANKRLSDKKEVLDAIARKDIEQMRAISDFFFETSGIYSRLCKYMAYMYNFDWMVTPHANEKVITDKDKDKIMAEFNKVLLYLDNSELKTLFGKISLKVIKNGCYYGYLVQTPKRITLQDLPVSYCRSRFSVNDRPAIEFNMKYFDVMFKDVTQRNKILNIFPPEFKKGYRLYKKGELVPQFYGDTEGWYLLDVNSTLKFNLNDEDSPIFISVIPSIIDLDEAKDLDRRKVAQELLKIIIQKMPVDKNGDLVFDVDEAKTLHENAVRMLSNAMGIDVLTTFAEVQVADMDSNRSTASTDDLQRVERSVFNEAGVSQMQFNTDGNLALEKSMLNDAVLMYRLVLQFQNFMNDILEKYNKKPKKYYYRAEILKTTIYNYQDLSQIYKEQMQVGFSKFLPQIALGQSQSSILASAYFENDVLDLVNVFIPPMMSSTMNSDVLNRLNNANKENGGRPEKSDDEKSEKTIMNEESQS